MKTLKEERSTRKKPREFDVTLSFAEEDRPFVDKVAEHLVNMGLNIFYDKDALIDSWGKDLYRHLDLIYREKAKFCVLFISRHYKKKRWSKHERIRAQARSFMEHREYMLPFRFDDTKIEEVPDNIVYLTVEEYNEEQLARAIFDKVESRKTFWYYFRRRFRPLLSGRAAVLTVTGGIFSISTLQLRDHLTPVDTLTERFYEHSTEVCHGSRCRDSSFSYSQGRGSCSWHDGVAYTMDSTIHHKSLQECRREAEAISWLPAPDNDTLKPATVTP